VYIYDGFDTSAPLVKNLTGDYNLSAPINVTTTQRFMYIRFTSDVSGVAGGFSTTFTSGPLGNYIWKEAYIEDTSLQKYYGV